MEKNMQNFEERIQHVKGTPYQAGYQMGKILGDRLERHIERYIREFAVADEKFVIDWDKLHEGAVPWLRTLPARFQEEFQGLADGAGVPFQRLAEWSFIEQCADLRCSSAVCLIDGRAWVARNNDTIAPGLWGYVSIREIDERIATIAFGCEGDVFTPTGINRERIWLHYNYLPAGDAPAPEKPHVPPFVWMMDALETCTSIEEVERLLHQNQRSDGMMLFAVDGKTDKFAIFECGCQVHYRLDPDGDFLVGTNHYCTIEDPSGPLEAKPMSTLSRFIRMEDLLAPVMDAAGDPDLPADLIRILADDQIERRGEAFATAYSTVACPQTGEMWYTFGGYPAASQGNWGRLAWPW
jgi:hypothetical protein